MKTISAITLVLILAQQAFAETWPQWRGPTRDGLFAGSEPWPEKLDGALKLKWESDLDDGYSGPIVSGHHVFTAETKDRQYEVVRAFSRENGKQIWEFQWEGKMSVPFFSHDQTDRGSARPLPTMGNTCTSRACETSSFASMPRLEKKYGGSISRSGTKRPYRRSGSYARLWSPTTTSMFKQAPPS